MEDTPKKPENNLNTPAPGGQDKNKRHWQVLLIDDLGRIVPIENLKTIAGIGISLLITFMILAVTFFILYINNRGPAYSTKDEVAQYKAQIKSLQNEVDILTAKMVLSGSLQKNKPEDEKTELKKKTENRVSEKKEKTAPPEKPAPPPPPPSSQPEKKQPLLTANDFAFTHITYQNILRIRFTIKNANSRFGKASGYIFLILKENEKNSNSWLTIPAVDIINGKPAQPRRGQYFKISNYKTVHFKFDGLENPQRFLTAELFVLDQNGNVILQIKEPIAIKTIEGVKPPDSSVKESRAKKQTPSDSSAPEEKQAPSDKKTPQGKQASSNHTAENKDLKAEPGETATVQDDPGSTPAEPEQTPVPEE